MKKEHTVQRKTATQGYKYTRAFSLLFASALFFVFTSHCARKTRTPCEVNYNCLKGLYCVHGFCSKERPIQPEKSGIETPSEKEPIRDQRFEPQKQETTAQDAAPKVERSREESAVPEQTSTKEKIYRETEHGPKPDTPPDCTTLVPLTNRIDFGIAPLYGSTLRKVQYVNKGRSCWYLGHRIPTSGKRPLPAYFSFVQTPLSPSFIRAGQTIELTIKFQSNTRHGAKYGATLQTIGSSDQDVYLYGETERAYTFARPRVLRFPATTEGCVHIKKLHLFSEEFQQARQTLTLNIRSSAPSSFWIAKHHFLPHRLKRGKVLSLDVLYKASAKGPKAGALDIYAQGQLHPLMQITMQGQSTASKQRREFFRQFTTPKVDVLFMMDYCNSPARPAQVAFKKNIGIFFDYARRLKADFHVGLVGLGTRRVTPPEICLRGKTPLLTSKTPRPEEVLRQLPETTAWGYHANSPHRAFQALFLNAYPKHCNRGFLRADAKLAIVAIAGGVDKSPYDFGFYKAFLQQLKGHQHKDLVNIETWAPPPKGCTNPEALLYFTRGTPRHWAWTQTMQGTATSICNVNKEVQRGWAERIFRFRQRFTLAERPRAGSVQVKINAKAQNTGWTVQQRSIVFAKDAIPASGATIEVSYQVDCKP